MSTDMPDQDQHDGHVLPYASNAPGGLGTPNPRTDPHPSPASGVITATGVATAGVAVPIFLAIVAGNMNTVRGATRSAKLQWEQRQQEIDRTIAQDPEKSQ